MNLTPVLKPWPRFSNLISALDSTSQIIIYWAPFLGAIAAVIALYRFWYLRPSLRVRANIRYDPPVGSGLVTFHPSFIIENIGNRFAENVYIELNASDFGFDRDDDQDHPSTILTLNSNTTGYIGSNGVLEQIFIDESVYHGQSYSIYFGGIELEPNEEYELYYTVACRSHGPRNGKFIFKILRHDVQVESIHPTKKRRLLSELRLKDYSYKQPEPSAEIIYSSVSSDDLADNDAIATTKIKNTGDVRLRFVDLHTEFFDRTVNDENLLGKAQHRFSALEPGETVKTQSRLEIDRDAYDVENIVVENTIRPTTTKARRRPRGIKLIDTDITTFENSSLNSVEVAGKVHNKSLSETPRVDIHAKFYNDVGEVIDTSSKTLRNLSGSSNAEFSIRSDSAISEEVSEHQIVIMS